MTMRNVKLVIEYKGTNYAGFQKQPDQLTIQDVLEKILSQMLQEKVTLTGAGRTDAGVHAKGQTANFFTASEMECGRIKRSANSLLPEDIAIKEVLNVSETFNARRDAVSREYKYLVLNKDYPSPFWNDISYFYHRVLNVEAMSKAANVLEGTHDFSSFCVAVSAPEQSTRNMHKIVVQKKEDLIHFDFQANAFLHNMVRIIVGTLIQVGAGERHPQQLVEILEARDRTKAGPTAPAHGLTLMKVNY